MFWLWLVALAAYYVGMGLSLGFFKAMLYRERPMLARVYALLWPIGWLIFFLATLFTWLEVQGGRAGAVAVDKIDEMGG